MLSDFCDWPTALWDADARRRLLHNTKLTLCPIMNHLDIDVLHQIYQHLDQNSLVAFKLVCRLF